nr:ALF repeat-containing protein [Streptomyces sp. SID5785]
MLIAAPASAADAPAVVPAPCVAATTAPDGSPVPVDSMSDDDVRVAIFRVIGNAATGRGVQAAAQRAMDGTIEDQRAFLTTGCAVAQAEDDAVAVFRILGVAQQNNDRAVVREATRALDDGSPAALRAFIETGRRLAQAEDDQVAIFRILADPQTSPAVRAAAEAALDDGSPEALRSFLEHRAELPG